MADPSAAPDDGLDRTELDPTELDPTELDSTELDPTELAVDHRLAALGVPFEMMACDPALADTAAFCAAYGIAPEDSANTIVVAAREDPPRYVACVVLATHRLDVNNAVRKRLGARKVSFADGEATRELTGMELGGVTPFGLPDGLPIWVDAAVAARPQLVFGGGSRRRKVLGPAALLLAMPDAEIVDGLARPAPST